MAGCPDRKDRRSRGYAPLVRQQNCLVGAGSSICFREEHSREYAFGRWRLGSRESLAAAKAAAGRACHEFIKGLSMGYGPQVGENGTQLSGSQRSGVALRGRW